MTNLLKFCPKCGTKFYLNPAPCVGAVIIKDNKILDTYGSQGWPTLNLYYFCTIKSGKLKPASDVTELKWFNLEALPVKIAFQNTKDVLKRIKNENWDNF